LYSHVRISHDQTAVITHLLFGCLDVIIHERQLHSFIHSGYFYRAFSSPLLLRGTPDYSIDAVPELTREALQATASEALAQ